MTPVLAADPSARRAAIASHLAGQGHSARLVEGVGALRDALRVLERPVVITADPWPRALDYVVGAREARVPSLVLWPTELDEYARTEPDQSQFDLSELAPGLERAALERGVRGVLCWPASPVQLSAALAAVAAGLRVMGIREPGSRVARPQARIDGATLSPRERAILSRVAAGTSNKGMARTLGVSPETVKGHMRSIFKKLGVATRAEAVAEALRRGELAL
jgi:DNA-binding CsgD family transcriptional regulator